MTTTPIIRITDDADRATIEAAVRELRARAKRLPAHWVERRQQVADEVDELVDRWIALGA